MSIKIQTEKPEIPIEIGHLKFVFDVTDESIKAFYKNGVKIKRELESINLDENDDKAFEQIKDVLRRGFTLLLGEGSFEQIYELSPSVFICMKYLAQISEGIDRELANMGYSSTQEEKARKYLAKKK